MAPARPRSSVRGGRGRADRLLAGVATVFCSAAVVVLLGLLGDAAAGWNAGPDAVAPPAVPAVGDTGVR
ncbi:hypothetical protein WIS52_26160 [Pseudonocardia nematodicida]|uniref:Uncharacterized protein n=1 Tax=Pseudonocardia nematodicida TaxID=1206997 RepID=A0ABV1KK56_9PSEU